LRRIPLLTLALALFAVAAGCSTGLPPLSLALEPGPVDHYRVNVDHTMTIDHKGRPMPLMEAHSIVWFDQEVIAPTADGNYRLRLTIRRLQLQAIFESHPPDDPNSRQFDSAAPEPKTEHEKPLMELIDKPLTVTLDRTGHVKSIAGYAAIEAAARALPGKEARAGANGLMNAFGPDWLTKHVEAIFTALPAKPNKDRVQWESTRKLFYPSVGAFPITQKNTLDNAEENPALISFQAPVRPTAELKVADAPLQLNRGRVIGQMTVDRKTGRLERFEEVTTLYFQTGTTLGARSGVTSELKTFIARK
jgi:Family of unknown function (DUF6263)